MDTSNMTRMTESRPEGQRTKSGGGTSSSEDRAAQTTLALRTWNRYAYARDNGHQQFVEKADVCSAFFRGDQWREEDLAHLRAANRPALTINKIKPTILTQLGEQAQQRAEISFRPKDGAPAATAETLTKVFKHISEVQQLDWKRSDMFADGMITNRGYMDIRMNFDESLSGNIEYTVLNPKNVIPDPDADQYDPDQWNEVMTSKWVTIDDLELLYGEDKAERLRGREGSSLPFGYDSIDRVRDRFGERDSWIYGGVFEDQNVTRSIRVIERQHRVLTRQRHLVDLRTGDMRPIPEAWKPDRVAQVAQQYGLGVTKKLVKRIRWDVVADGEVMHSEWSPYKHFTVVPYFPMFIHGHTLGAVEDLLDPQELLNKSLSQELHIINSTANAGWIVKQGAVTNMSPEQLEARGAETGLVIEVRDNVNEDVAKIQPNQLPTGLDRLSFKAEEHIKGISNVSDSMQGMDREDVAAKAIQQKRQAGAASHAKPLDSLTRTDWLIARNTLDLVQEFYTDERVLTITHDRISGETEDVAVNQVQTDGSVVNDLSAGEYDVVISSVPLRETLEDSQFDQAVSMREMGVSISDEVIIGASRLQGKAQILKDMAAVKSSPQAQEQQQLAVDAQKAEIGKTQAETQVKLADAALKGAKTDKEGVSAHKEAITPIESGDGGQAQAALDFADQEHKHNLEIDQHEHDKSMDERKFQLEERKAQADAERDDRQAAAKAVSDRVAAAHAATQPATSKEKP